MTHMKAEAAYSALIDLSRQAALLGSCAELLGWDEETYMPSGGTELRGRQMALLAGLYHERITDPRIGELIAEIEGSPLVSDPVSPEAVNVREIGRNHARACDVPRSLVEELARTTSLAQQEWAVAWRRSDWARFLPWLEKIIRLKRKEAESHGSGTSLYDALLEDYEPGCRTSSLTSMFALLRKELSPLLAEIRGAARQPDVGILARRYPFQRQKSFAHKVLTTVGFDFTRGRLDSTTHPFFSAIGPGDVRITTRYALNHFSEAFFATLHEMGHGLYEQGLLPAHHGTPMADAPSLGMHEGQARLWENAVGRSLGFWKQFFPLAQEKFPAALKEVKLDHFHFAVHHVVPSLNRVRADEVTYNLHIGIRFELEQALIAGDLKPADLPEAWNAAYERDLGVRPASDGEGCLQDGHWAAGMFGYFPTYTIGNIFAAQLVARARQELGDLDQIFADGEFAVLLDWLRRNVYEHGSRLSAPGLIESVTGNPPDPQALVKFLTARYRQVYGLA
jgi:carboxypeptidase Taq